MDKSQFFVANYHPFYYTGWMSRKDLTKEVMYEGVKKILETPANHIHLPQQKLYTLYSLAFNYFLYLSENHPGHYIVRVEDSYLLEKLQRKSKDDTSRKFIQKLALPRKLKFGKSTFHLDFFNFSTWNNTNELAKDRIQGALIVKNASKSPIDSQFGEDEAYNEALKALPENYYHQSLTDFVPKTIVIAFEEEFQDVEKVCFDFIKDEDQNKILKGVSISSDLDFTDIE